MQVFPLSHCGLVMPYCDMRSGSTLAQVMACCLAAPSHYLNQWWLLMSEFFWRSPESHLMSSTKLLLPILSLEIILISPWEISISFQEGNLQVTFSEWWLRYLWWNCPQMNVTRPYWWWVNIGSGNGLVPSGNKPLPEPMLTQIYVAKWRH